LKISPQNYAQETTEYMQILP